MRSRLPVWTAMTVLAGCATGGDGGWRTLPPGPPAVVSFDPIRAPARAAAPPSEAAVSFAISGWRKPQMSVAYCVRDSVEVPEEQRGYVRGRVLVKFAVLKSGEPVQYSVLTEGVPDSIQEAIWSGIQSCQWLPGADPQGRPANIWVILPFRFKDD